MTNFTFTQACEGRGGAARRVSLRAAVPFLGISSPSDIMTYTGILLFVVFIIFLLHREIRKSRKENGVSEKTIHNERDNLEKRVAERTKELITAETERLNELNRTIQFGELSRGLFHDLMSPLTAVSLYIEKLGTQNLTQSNDALLSTQEAQEMVEKAVGVSKRMNSYMESVRRCIGNAQEISVEVTAEMSQELGIIRDVLGYKARMSNVTLITEPCETIYLRIHPVRLHQLLLNLTSNAIEACEEAAKVDSSKKERTVTIAAHKTGDETILTVSDNGIGMSPEQAASLFETTFTTKQHGLGIGLKTVRTIVEDELKGTIDVKSVRGVGTTFTVRVQK